MACPHVSGVAALVVSYNYGAITNAQLRERLEGTTTDIYADNPSYEGQLGTGVVDAYGALTGEVAPPPPPSYCASRGNSVADEWIAEVKVGEFTNVSTASGYTNFTDQTIELPSGVSIGFSLKPGFSAGSYKEYWKIWIDFNGDKEFDDAAELVFDAGSLSKTTVNGIINVPASAEGITTRMRVSMKYKGAQTSCESFSYGEIEDYTVVIGEGAKTPECNAPANLSASHISSNGATISWEAIDQADSYKLRYRATGTSTWASIPTNTSSFTLSNLSPGTEYEAQVAAVCQSGTSAFSPEASFVTSTANLNYCASKGENTTFEWIDYVALNGIERSSSSDGGYFDGTDQQANLLAGSDATVFVSAGFARSNYTEYWRIWIDLNQDGDFTDSGEQLVSGSSSSSGTLSATLTIPPGAKTGTTRMRVSMKYGGAPDPCETFSYGEVEDFTVNITNTAVSSESTYASLTAEMLGDERSKARFNTFPNPAHDKLIVSTMEESAFDVTVYDLNGRVLTAIKSNKSKLELNVSALKNGIYLIKVKGERETSTLKFVIE